jgi:hypothetical protein
MDPRSPKQGDGESPGDVSNGTFIDVTINSVADNGLDFESNAAGFGVGTLTFEDVVLRSRINIVEPSKLITFDSTARTGRYVQIDGLVGYDGIFTCDRNQPIKGCATVTGGTIDLWPGSTFTYKPGKTAQTEPFMFAKPPGTINGS